MRICPISSTLLKNQGMVKISRSNSTLGTTLKTANSHLKVRVNALPVAVEVLEVEAHQENGTGRSVLGSQKSIATSVRATPEAACEADLIRRSL